MLSPETTTIQKKLGDYCRTGVLPDIPGIHPTHIRQYRRLVFNAVKSNIRKAFPVADSAIDKELLLEMIGEFFSRHEARTSQIWKLPGEFYEYAVQEEWAAKYNMPWLNDLLLLEWTELKVYTMPDGRVGKHRKEGDLMNDVPVFTPDFVIVCLAYPVHLMALKDSLHKKDQYYILIHRNQDDGKVSFLSLSKFFVHILKKLQDEQITLKQALENTLRESGIKNTENLVHATQSFFRELYDCGFILGFGR